MDRILYKTPAFDAFYGSLNVRTKKNFINANEIVLLNGFIKKSTADYEKQIATAQKIMEDFL